MAVKYENFITGDDTHFSVGATQWVAQTFTATSAHNVTSVKLLLNNADGTLTVSIRATSGGAPSGADLASGTFDTSGLSASSTWETITMGTPCNLTSGAVYAIVCRSTSDYTRWRSDTEQGYAGGATITSTNPVLGTNWNAPAAYDQMFEIWGDAPAGGARIINFI
jgi:hypothetical protein